LPLLFGNSGGVIVKSFLALAALAAMGAPAAFAQDGQGSLRLLSGTPAAPTAEAPAVIPEPPAQEREPLAHEAPASPSAPAEAPATMPAVAAATVPPAVPAIAATGWKGPVSFAPIAVVDLIGRVCRAAASGDGSELQSRAVDLGLGTPRPAPDMLAHALPQGAVTWQVPSTEGVLYLFGYGESPLKCGAAVVRPMPEEGFNKVFALLQAPEQGYVSDSSQNLPGDIRWARLRSPKNEFVDVMEYPVNGDTPGVLRADFLPN
jgi:hypothetical protein